MLTSADNKSEEEGRCEKEEGEEERRGEEEEGKGKEGEEERDMPPFSTSKYITSAGTCLV